MLWNISCFTSLGCCVNRCSMYCECCIFCVNCDASSSRCCLIGSMLISFCVVLLSLIHPVAMQSAELCGL